MMQRRADDGGIRSLPDVHFVVGGSGKLGKRYYNNTPPSPLRTVDSTTGQEAQVIWACNTNKVDADELAKDVVVARRAAVLAGGFRCVVIRVREHKTMYERDQDGRLVTTSTAWTPSGRPQPLSVPSDPHMTVAMGRSFNNLQIQGHLFLYPYGPEKGELMENRPEDWRQFYQDDFERTQPFEFWTMRGVSIALKSNSQLVLPEPEVRASD